MKINIWYVLAGFLLLGGGGYAVYQYTRNVRNHNPGNIEYDGTVWQGMDNPPSDGKFVRFISDDYGFRALARIIGNYVSLDGVMPTVAGIIGRWAPPTENDTSSYIKDVAESLGVNPNATLDISSYTPALALAIANHEGINNWNLTDAARGAALA